MAEAIGIIRIARTGIDRDVFSFRSRLCIISFPQALLERNEYKTYGSSVTVLRKFQNCGTPG
jgi:hypothetical protein